MATKLPAKATPKKYKFRYAAEADAVVPLEVHVSVTTAPEGSAEILAPELSTTAPIVAPVVPDELTAAEPQEIVGGDDFDEIDGDLEQTWLEGEIEVGADESDRETVAVAMENLGTYIAEGRHLVKTNTCTNATASLLELGIRTAMDQLGGPRRQIGLESHTGTPLARHVAALEDATGFLSRLKQTWLLGYKHRFDLVGDLVRTTESQIGKYEVKLDQAEEILKKHRSALGNSPYKSTLTELWLFFSDTTGQRTDVLAALKHDLEFSKYALTVYPPKARVNAERVYKTAFNGSRGGDAVKLVREIEKLPHAFDLFDKRFGTYQLLDKVKIVEEKGSNRKTLSIGETAFPRLAELASRHYYVESSSLKHLWNKAHSGDLRSARKSAEFEITPGELEQVIAAGRQYLANVRTYVADQKKYLALIKEFDDLYDGALADDYVKDNQEFSVWMQIFNVADAYDRSIRHPAHAEVARSIKAVKYCAYLVKTVANQMARDSK